ncbi:MAG: TonB-dependent siderophore receptor [Methylophaga sp.]
MYPEIRTIFRRKPLMLVISSLIFSGVTYAGNTNQSDDGLTLDAISVTGQQGSEYAINQSKTITKTDIPISESPFSVQVISKQVLEDQGALGLEDVYQNVSGVVESGNTLNAQSEVLPFIRGFESPNLLRNGMRASLIGAVDLFNIESVEVLKGPASILFGALEPGGVVNYTTKMPQAEPFTEFRQQFGSDDLSRTTVDSTGAVNDAETILYRFNAAYTDSNSFRDDISLDRLAVAPVVTFLTGENTSLSLDLTYTRERLPYDSGVPVAANGSDLVDRDTFFGDKTLDGRELEDIFAGYTLEHAFNDNVTLTNRLQFHRSLPKNESIRHTRVSADEQQLELRYQNEERVEDEVQFVTDLQTRFSTGGLDHEALIGLDLIRQTSEFRRYRQDAGIVDINDDPNVRFTPPADMQLEKDFDDERNWAAVYFHDQISMLEDGRLKLLVGGRYDSVEQKDRLASTSIRDQEFTARAGLLYKLTETLSPYVSVSESFNPQLSGTEDRQGNQLAPETGIQYEAGLKFESLNGGLLATASVYEIEKEDVAVFDQDFFNETGGGIAFFPGVNQRSRGFEFDLNGRITDGLNIIANYAYTDTEVLENAGDPDSVGDRLGNVPLHTARLWLNYQFAPSSRLQHVGMGAGVRYESERMAQFDSIEIDDFTVFDAAVWYKKPISGGRTFTAQLNLKNLTDEEYYARGSTQAIFHYGQPFTVLGAVGLQF